jgi:hypothetical protein
MPIFSLYDSTKRLLQSCKKQTLADAKEYFYNRYEPYEDFEIIEKDDRLKVIAQHKLAKREPTKHKKVKSLWGKKKKEQQTKEVKHD